MLYLNIMIFTVFFALMFIKDFFQKYKKKLIKSYEPQTGNLVCF